MLQTKSFYLLAVLAISLSIFWPAYAKSDKFDKKQSIANYEKITGEALKAVFNETTMIGEYHDYRDKTKTYNYTEFHHKNGTTDYVEGDKHEKGIWKIIGGDKICYRYPKSDYYKGTYCFFVYKNDKCYYKYSPYNMSLKGPRDWNKWSSRAVRKGDGGSCEEAIG